MRHVVIEGPGQVTLRDAPDPTPPGPGGAVVAIEAAAICGSDLHFYDGDLPVGDSFPIGHELVGTVADVGAEVRRFRPGDRVLAASVTGCGHCDGCATGDPVRCRQGPKVLGAGELGGAQASAIAIHAADFQLLAVPEGMSDDAALLLTDNLNTGWIGAKRADFSPGDTVAVLGLGAVGQCAVRSAFLLGAARVLVADPVVGRRALAAEWGAEPLDGPTTAAVLEATGGRGADAVIDAVASDVSLDDAFASVRPGGTVSVVGVHDLEPYPLPVLMGVFRSVTLRMTTAPVHQTWQELVPLVMSGRLRTEGIITDELPLDRAAEAYELAAARRADTLKLMMRP